VRAKVYIETSIVSYHASRRSRDLVIAGHQEATEEFWSRLELDFEPYVSALVLAECGQGNAEQAERRSRAVSTFRVIQITSEAESLARKIITGGGVPAEYPEDALRIALATMGGVDFLVTWNFSHINNPFTRTMIRQIIQNEGYVCPEIVSPDELLGTEP
jgi:hypothetical protein